MMLLSKGSISNPMNKPTKAVKHVPWRSVFALLAAYLLCFTWYHYSGISFQSRVIQGGARTGSLAEDRPWRWNEIIPRTSLVWDKCFNDLECARLDVPLDWLDPSNDTRVALAVIRLRATEMEDYRGPVFVNPGGPGGSGVEQVIRAGKYLQTIIGKNHDIISFDPRGVGATSLKVNCWASKQSSHIWSLLDVGTIDSHPGVLYDAYARALAESDMCALAAGASNGKGAVMKQERMLPMNTERVQAAGPLRFVSTASVARDMLEILDQTGWPKLRYWGFSYGTMLGGTFASMYPDRVERLVSDGNVNYDEWTTATHMHFLEDADKVMDAFYHFCHSAGPHRCDFYAKSPAAIEERLQKLLEVVRKRPVVTPAPPGSMGVPEMVFYSSVKRLISAALYRPIFMFPSLARVLAALERRDGAPFLDLVLSEGNRVPFSCQNESLEPPDNLDESSPDGAFKAIMCSDGPPEYTDDDIEMFEEYATLLQEQSKAAGAVNVLFKMACAGWQVNAKWRFSGPFGGNTNFPILFVANHADNVSPLRSARSNAAKFNESALLVQNSFGHTSLSAPSLCTAKHIRAYFQDGVVPAVGITCEPDGVPFGDREDGTKIMSDNDKVLSDALWRLALSKHIMPL